MTTAVQSPPAPAGDPFDALTSRRRAMLALARTEGVRLLRHPVAIAAVLLFTGPWLFDLLTGDVNRYPVLHYEDQNLQFPAALLLGCAAMVVGNLAVLRARRHGTTGLYDVLVLPTAWRIGGHLLALLPFVLLTAALVAARITVTALAPGAVGRINPYELAVSPAAVLLLGAIGILLARLVDSVIMALVAALGFAVATVAVAVPSPRTAWASRLLPATLQEGGSPLPVDLLARPAAAHLVYLVGLVCLVAVAALANAGARGRAALGMVAAGLTITVGGGIIQALPVPDTVTAARATAADRPTERQSCTRLGHVDYCAFPDFAPWIPDWDKVVRGVLRGVPATEAGRPLAVRQRLPASETESSLRPESREERDAKPAAWRRADVAAGTPNAVSVGTRWGDGYAEAGFAGLVAYEVLSRAGAGEHGPVCGGRGVLVGWLAGQATPETAAGLRKLNARSFGAILFGDLDYVGGVSVPDREIAVALALLERPAAEVAATVLASWAELSAAGTTTERVGEIFGTPVAPQPPIGERTVCQA